MPEQQHPTVEPWREFEHRVATLYRLLGFDVVEDLHLTSVQTDLLCTKLVSGAPPIRLYVECKYREKPSVSNQAIRELLASYDALKAEHKLTGAVVVSNHFFTAQAKALVGSRTDVRLLTEQQLSDELIATTARLESFVSDYTTRAIFSCYISLRCQDKAGHTTGLHEWAQQWLQTPTPLGVVLGDFGSGKTTFLHYLKYRLACEYLGAPATRIPVYLSLRHFSRFPDLKAFITGQMLVEFGVPDYGRFEHLLRNGRLLLLLDGFDEIAQRVDRELKERYFLALTPLLIPGSKAILTCRPGYFVTDAEFMDLVNRRPGSFSELGSTARLKPLEPFLQAVSDWSTQDTTQVGMLKPAEIHTCTVAHLTDNEIDWYLKARDGEIRSASGTGWEDLKERIERTYDLKDLARRPILLNLMVATLPFIHKAEALSPAVIYQRYTESWLSHEYAKGEVRWLIDRNVKLQFMELLATQMWTQRRSRVLYTELSKEICDAFNVVDPSALEHLATDIRTCSFLIRDADGFFEFVHKSFMEFFVAVRLKRQLLDHNSQALESESLSPEILYFLGDMAHFDPAFESCTRQLLKAAAAQRHRTTDLLLGNGLGLLGWARLAFSNERWRNVVAGSLTFFRCSLQKSQLGANDIERLEFRRCEMRACSVEGEWRLLEVNDSDLGDCTLRYGGTSARQRELTRASSPEMPATPSLVTIDSRLKNVSISMRGRWETRGATLEHCQIEGRKQRPPKAAPSKPKEDKGSAREPSAAAEHGLLVAMRTSTFRNCVFRHLDFGWTLPEQCTFVNCCFIGCWRIDEFGIRGMDALTIRVPDQLRKIEDEATKLVDVVGTELKRVRNSADRRQVVGEALGTIPKRAKLCLVYVFDVPIQPGIVGDSRFPDPAIVDWFVNGGYKPQS